MVACRDLDSPWRVGVSARLALVVARVELSSKTYRRTITVERRTTGTKAYHHPLVGDLTVHYQALNPSGDPDQILIVYTTEPGSADETALRLLANWRRRTAHRDHAVRPVAFRAAAAPNTGWPRPSGQ